MSQNTMSNDEYTRIWDKPIIKIGVITMLMASITVCLPVIYICIKTGVYPTAGEILKCFSMSASTWGALYVVEPLTYYTVVGLSGTYVAFLTGNIGNMRIPCAAAALEVTGAQPGTREGEIVSTLGITGSAITSIFFTTLAAVLGIQIMAILPEQVINAFNNYTVPAIFGAVLGQYALKEVRLSVFSIILALVFIYIIKVPSYIAMFSSVILTVAFARVLYVSDKKKEKDKMKVDN